MNEDDKKAEALRLEYGEIGEYVRTGTSVIWDAFKTYFTVAALMFAAFSFLAWGEGQLDGHARQVVLGGIATAGTVVTLLAMRAIYRVEAYLGVLFERGKVVEEAIGDSKMPGVLAKLKAVWGAPNTFLSAPGMTVLVFGIFLIAWAMAIPFAVLSSATAAKSPPSCVCACGAPAPPSSAQ